MPGKGQSNFLAFSGTHLLSFFPPAVSCTRDPRHAFVPHRVIFFAHHLFFGLGCFGLLALLHQASTAFLFPNLLGTNTRTFHPFYPRTGSLHANTNTPRAPASRLTRGIRMSRQRLPTACLRHSVCDPFWLSDIPHSHDPHLPYWHASSTASTRRGGTSRGRPSSARASAESLISLTILYPFTSALFPVSPGSISLAADLVSFSAKPNHNPHLQQSLTSSQPTPVPASSLSICSSIHSLILFHYFSRHNIF